MREVMYELAEIYGIYTGELFFVTERSQERRQLVPYMTWPGKVREMYGGVLLLKTSDKKEKND